MADIAIGRPCPRCGTLTAISGSFTDPVLHGVCACCGNMVSATAYGGERAHAARAAGIPVTSQGQPLPVVPTIAPVPAPVVPTVQMQQSVPTPAPAAVITASANAPKSRGNEKQNADAA